MAFNAEHNSRSTEWNLNIHCDQFLLELAEAGDSVLDVGCGDGFLSARLAEKGCTVVALDLDAGVLERAQARWPDHSIQWICGDVLTYDFVLATFDAVLSNATLHHLPDTEQALERFAELLRPGGRLGVIGFARNGLLDWPRSLIGAALISILNLVKGKWEHTAPRAWPPAYTYGQLRHLSKRALPGRRYQRLWLGRYRLTWRKATENG